MYLKMLENNSTLFMYGVTEYTASRIVLCCFNK